MQLLAHVMAADPMTLVAVYAAGAVTGAAIAWRVASARGR